MAQEVPPPVDLRKYAEVKMGLPEGVRPVDVIEKTRDGVELTAEEIRGFVNGCTSGLIPDYQAAAWLMAARINGLTRQEATDLTLAMAASGEVLDLSEFGRTVDKHSTGGVGDKTSLVVAPIAASLGLPVGKMSGRGLGHTGGTLDKLESIPGYRIDLDEDEFVDQLQDIGIVLTGQSADLAPADGKLYALRDVTGTVDSTALIAASIMSKKLASGAQAIVLDVKAGDGAFMKTPEDAEELAQLMVDIGRGLGRDMKALIADMNQPLGRAVGNALEVKEAIDTLKGVGPVDFTNHCIEVAAWMAYLGEKAESIDQARELVRETIRDKRALHKFRELVSAQGGDARVVDNPEQVLKIAEAGPVLATQSGYIKRIDPLVVGEAVMRLGGGREKKGDSIDHSVGALVSVKVGDRVEVGDVIIQVFSDDTIRRAEQIVALQSAIEISADPVERLPLFHKKI